MGGFRQETQQDIDGRRSASSRRSTSGCSSRRSRRRSRSSAQSSIIDSSRAGTADNVSHAGGREPADDQRATSSTSRAPRRTSTRCGLNEDPLALSVAGRNNRYNNVQIDGAVNNDVFGLARVGHARRPDRGAADQPRRDPGAAAGRLAVRRAAGRVLGRRHQRHHQERHATRSGARRTSSAATRTGSGESPEPARRSAQFKDQQFGGSVGGPIVQNKAFFFGNVDWGRRDNPSGVLGQRQPASSSARAAEIERFLNILQNRYSYDPGRHRRVHPHDRQRQVLRPRRLQRRRRGNQLTVRHNYLDALNDIGRPTTWSLYFMPDNFYRIEQQDELDRRAVEQHVRARRSTSCGSPTSASAIAAARDSRSRSGRSRSSASTSAPANVRAGRENFSTANELDQDVYELTDDFTLAEGQAHVHVRHAQRVLQVPEPVHPRQLRQLPLRQPRPVRAGHRAAATTTASR